MNNTLTAEEMQMAMGELARVDALVAKSNKIDAPHVYGKWFIKYREAIIKANSLHDGYVLVPIEPTKEMLDVAVKWFSKYVSVTKVYQEMIAASPKG